MEQSYLAQFDLKVNGADASLEVMDAMLDCTVETSIHLPDVCTLRLNDANFKWLDADDFREGKRVEVSAGYDKAQLVPLFDGEVAALELDLAAEGVPTLVVRCYDRAHRLHRGRYRRSFVQMTDSDIVGKIGKEAGFTVEADDTPQVHDWVFQNNQTNWEFLSQRAAYNGFRLYVEGQKELHFAAVKNTADETVTLEWGEDLRSFRPRIAAGAQVDEVIVRGWDPQKKLAIVGSCTKPQGIPQIGESKSGGEIAKAAFSAGAQMVVVDRPVHSQAEAQALAQSICDDIGGEFLEADGLCYGRPELQAGTMVKIANIGKRFSGSYYVTSATHVYSTAVGYATHFAVTGKRSSTLLSLLENDGAGRRMPLGGNIVIGIVTDNLDPENLGRVKVKYPWLTEEHTSYWARQASPMAGPTRGFYFLPEIDDEVLVAFEHGDIRRPYVIGALWNGKDTPVEDNAVAVQDAKVNRRTIKTRIGHTLLFDDTEGKGEIKLKTANKHELTLDDANQNITAKTKSGHKVLLDDDNDKIVVVDKSGKNSITIETSDNSISMKCLGDFSVDAKGKVTVKGAKGVEVTTPMKVEMKGVSGVDVTTTALMNLKAGTVLSVQGPLVKIN